MLDYAAKLTLTPARMEEADLSPLRDAGFDDSAILEIVQVVSFFNYINRVADALGIENEPDWEK